MVKDCFVILQNYTVCSFSGISPFTEYSCMQSKYKHINKQILDSSRQNIYGLQLVQLAESKHHFLKRFQTRQLIPMFALKICLTYIYFS